MVMTFKRWFARHDAEFRYLNFLAFLLVLFCLTPVFERTYFGMFVLELLFSIVLLSGALAIAKNRRLEIAGILAAVAALIAAWVAFVLRDSTAAIVVNNVLNVVFLSFVGVVILADVVKREHITMDQVVGAICVYALMGIIWGMVYEIIQLVSPDGAFRLAEGVGSGGGLPNRLNMLDSQLMYFSFITLTTVGYGDIVPMHPAACSLSCLEAVVGQVYLAVLIANLVARHVAHLRIRHEEEKERGKEQKE